MSTTVAPVSSRAKPLRLWPGIAGAIVVIVARLLPDVGRGGIVIGLSGAALVLLWWLFFSRARWVERIVVVLLIPVAAMLTQLFAHASLGGGENGNVGMLAVFLLPITIPPFLVAGAILSRHSSLRRRLATMTAAILLGSGIWVLARGEGISGGATTEVAWRWTPTAEAQLLATTRNETPTTPAAPEINAAAPIERDAPTASTGTAPLVAPVLWSGFRGSERDAALDGVRINTDWTTGSPKEVWRRRVGPGWSSFAVSGDLVITQEQRGDHETVSAYRLNTGEPVWRHQDTVRFYEAAAGAGPRGTPTVHEGRVYAMGATGIVNALDARTGARLWTRDAERDTGAPRPDWGFAASPVIVGELLVGAASGRLVAYELATGNPRWTRTTSGGGYSSPQLATLAGVQQILLLNGGGITSVDLDGNILWASHAESGMAIVQPQVLDDNTVLVASGESLRGMGIRRLAVSRAPDGSWKTEERWMSRGLKPYFSDFVVHEGHAYGFDGTILSAINLDTGERVWKGGRYGAGQMLLLPDQDLLLVLSEEGDLALVTAAPDKYTEVAKVKAIDGKTWNHPVLVGDLLLVRNGEEMAAFRLRR